MTPLAKRCLDAGMAREKPGLWRRFWCSLGWHGKEASAGVLVFVCRSCYDFSTFLPALLNPEVLVARRDVLQQLEAERCVRGLAQHLLPPGEAMTAKTLCSRISGEYPPAAPFMLRILRGLADKGDLVCVLDDSDEPLFGWRPPGSITRVRQHINRQGILCYGACAAAVAWMALTIGVFPRVGDLVAAFR